ncbi:MAG: DUF3243 domain-containing protein [Firmicutes bacterium]|nr:DUF3243 domain-containing protein [Bacillota bacterium]
MEIGESWHDWKRLLGKAVHAADTAGISEKTVDQIAYRLGGFFAGTFDPANREQRLLKELWEVGDEEEKKVLASMVAKLCERDAASG